ncbi:MAG: hypothetical protein Q9164_004983, partial [Protoblastenia rupestris]
LLTPASVGQYYYDPRPRDTFRVRANRSFQESRVPVLTDRGNSGELSQHFGIFRQRLIPVPLDAAALQSRVQSITPPPDEEKDGKESRLLEAQARKDLESDGCPACYSSHLDVPVRNPPEEYRPIVGYWQSFSSTGDVVLCA